MGNSIRRGGSVTHTQLVLLNFQLKCIFVFVMNQPIMIFDPAKQLSEFGTHIEMNRISF